MVKKGNIKPKNIYAWSINEWKETIKTLETIVNSDKSSYEKKLALVNTILMISNNNKTEKFNKEVESILNSKKKPWVKKLSLFNLIKDLPIEESPKEKEKNNHLLESYLFTEFAKRSMEEYKKTESRKHS